MNIYFDLDGTLIDVSERFYRIYCDLLDRFNCDTKLNKVTYWQLKKESYPEAEIVQKTCANIDSEEYMKLRQNVIESPKYLEYDRPFSYTLDTIKTLKKDNRLVIVSLRESLKKTEIEIDKLGFKPFFDKVLVHNEDMDNKWKIKAELIKSDSGFNTRDSIVVGDTETDFLAAKELGIDCFLVSSGIRTRDYLAILNCGIVIDSIAELEQLLESGYRVNFHRNIEATTEENHELK